MYVQLVTRLYGKGDGLDTC